jgi:hypothetical protein
MALSSMKNNNIGEKLHPQIQEKIDYIASPIYKRRLLELGQPKETVDKLIADRINELKKTKIQYNANLPNDALAYTDIEYGQPVIKLRTPDNPKYKSGSVLAHEIGHVTSGFYDKFGNYYKPTDEQGSYIGDAEARRQFNKLISSGGATSMSPKEKLFFDLQNQNLNYVAPKGSLIYKLTGGTSLNDYFYNKNKKEAWPSGTHVDLSEQKEPMLLGNFRNPNSPVNNPKIRPSLNLMKNPEYSKEFLSKPHTISLNTQGMPLSIMDPSDNPFAGGWQSHKYSAIENRGDLDAVRFLLKKHGYTKNFGDDITPEIWQKAIKDKNLNTDEQFKRMRENFDDKAIINLNNRVAKNELPSNLKSMRNTDYSS